LKRRPIRQALRLIYRLAILWFVDTIALWVTAALVPGMNIQPDEGGTLVIAASAALVLSIINLLIRPLVLVLALPLGFIAVFIIGFLVNAVVLWLTSVLLSPSFQVNGLLPAVLGSLVFSAINTVITNLMTVDDQDSFYQAFIERLARRSMFEGATGPERGVVMLEIDGLSYHHIKKAIKDGWMPNVSDLIDTDGYALSRVDCGLPSQTSACQSGIMFGNNYDIPAFRWFDKDRNKLMVSGSDATEINARYASGEGLMRSGTSINNMMNGDANKSLLTLADLRAGTPEDKKARARDISLLMLNPYFFMRTMVFFFQDVIVELWQGWRQRANDVQPRLNRLHKGYPFIRAATTVFMRDISSYLAILDIIRGSPSIYLTWPGYDEVAHHSGPWTKDAFGTLRQFDQVIGRIRDTISEKAPRPYELILLSDHGQSFGATFLQRYDYDLKEFIEKQLPAGTAVATVSGGDDGTISMAAMSGELENIQEERAGGFAGRAVISQTQKALSRGVDIRSGGADTEQDGVEEPASVTVCGSGNLAQVYFHLYPRKITIDELNGAYPGMVDALVAHEGVGFVVGYEDDGVPVVLGKGGRRNLHMGSVEGADPLQPYGDVTLRSQQVRRVADFPHAGDLIVNSTLFPDGTVAAMEELVGNHGGLGGEQTDAFILHPSDMEVPETKNSMDVFGILNSRRGLVGAPPKPASAEAEPVDPWTISSLLAGLRNFGTWSGLAVRAVLLDTRAYREIAANVSLTGPALLLAIIGEFILAIFQSEQSAIIATVVRVAAWVISVVWFMFAGRLLKGKAGFGSTFRVLGFAQAINILNLIAFIPVISNLTQIIVGILLFVATWIGVAQANELKGWRSLILPISYVVILILTLLIIGVLASGTIFTLETLGRSLGILPPP
jgi:uncharacterized membrane protein YvlD (DUF360 family)